MLDPKSLRSVLKLLASDVVLIDNGGNEWSPGDLIAERGDAQGDYCFDSLGIWKLNTKGQRVNRPLYAFRDTVTVEADDENNSAIFWFHLNHNFPSIAEALRDGPTSITMGTWEQIKKLNGFDDGPAYAPTALRIQECSR